METEKHNDNANEATQSVAGPATQVEAAQEEEQQEIQRPVLPEQTPLPAAATTHTLVVTRWAVMRMCELTENPGSKGISEIRMRIGLQEAFEKAGSEFSIVSLANKGLPRKTMYEPAEVVLTAAQAKWLLHRVGPQLNVPAPLSVQRLWFDMFCRLCAFVSEEPEAVMTEVEEAAEKAAAEAQAQAQPQGPPPPPNGAAGRPQRRN